METLYAVLPLVASHLQLTLVALVVALLVSLPLGVLLARSAAARAPALATAGVLQTIPSLALLALMVPVMAGLHSLAAPLGLDTPVLGFLPAVAALSLYGVLPILRNTVTGLVGVDATLVEAARGLGMSPRQVLLQVQLPLAAPVLFAGIRTATVWIVGTATLATPVGQQCLGDLIFGGLQTRNWSSVLIGCVAAAVLAIALDAVLGAMERAPTGRIRAGIGGLAGLALVSAAFGPALADLGHTGPRVVVGAKGFTEQFILARLIRRRLQGAGLDVTLREGLGSTIAFDALGEGGVDVYVDYSGTVWANQMGRDDTLPADQVLDAMGPWLAERDITLLGTLGFENAYALAVRRSDAEARHWTTVADLAPDAAYLTLGGDYEFFDRPEWLALRDTYRLRFRNQRRFDPTFLYDAVNTGEADAIAAFSSDGRLVAFDLVTLEDPEHALPPYDAIVLTRTQVDPAVARALGPLLGQINVGLMREANRRVDQDGVGVDAAAAWLDRELLRQQGVKSGRP